MSINVLHKTLSVNLDLDTTGFSGDAVADSELSYVQSLKAGRVVSIDGAGKVKLHDGNEEAVDELAIGFLANDAAGNYYENKPALASKLVAAYVGPTILESDQIVSGVTFSPGDPVFAGTSGNVGLLTNVDPGGHQQLGTCLVGNSITNPFVRIYTK